MALPAEVVRLDWSPETQDRLGALTSEAFARGARRVEVLVPVSATGRHLVHRAGFRREGLLRLVSARPDGSYEDAHLYARLVDDDVVGAGTFSTVMNAVLPKTRVIAHAVFRDDAGRVLLLEVSYKRDWELPGGVVEPHEPPRVGCEREVLEEIGLTVGLDRVLCFDWLPPYLGWDDADEVIFDGGVLSAAQIDAMVLGEGEIVAAHWVDPGDVAAHVMPLAARRLAWLLAHPDAPPTLFEDGAPVGL